MSVKIRKTIEYSSYNKRFMEWAYRLHEYFFQYRLFYYSPYPFSLFSDNGEHAQSREDGARVGQSAGADARAECTRGAAADDQV